MTSQLLASRAILGTLWIRSLSDVVDTMLRDLSLVRHTSAIFYLLSAMVAAAVALRGLGSVFVTGHQSRWIVAGLLLIFGLLLATEHLLSRRWAWYPHGYLAFQTGLILALLLLPP